MIVLCDIQLRHKANEKVHCCGAWLVWHQCRKYQSEKQEKKNPDKTKGHEVNTAGWERETILFGSRGVQQPRGSHQEQMHWNVIHAGVLCKMKDGRTQITQASPHRRRRCVLVLYSEGHSFPLRWLRQNTSRIVYLLESTNDMHWFLIHSLLNSALYPQTQAKWAQLQSAMPPSNSAVEEDDKGLKLGGKEQSKATCCLLSNPKSRMENIPCWEWQWMAWNLRLPRLWNHMHTVMLAPLVLTWWYMDNNRSSHPQ